MTPGLSRWQTLLLGDFAKRAFFHLLNEPFFVSLPKAPFFVFPPNAPFFVFPPNAPFFLQLSTIIVPVSAGCLAQVYLILLGFPKETCADDAPGVTGNSINPVGFPTGHG